MALTRGSELAAAEASALASCVKLACRACLSARGRASGRVEAREHGHWATGARVAGRERGGASWAEVVSGPRGEVERRGRAGPLRVDGLEREREGVGPNGSAGPICWVGSLRFSFLLPFLFYF